MRLHRQELGHVEQLRQQRKTAAVTAHERFAEHRVGVHGQQRRQRDRGAVGERQHARVQASLVVAVVGRDLERLAERAAGLAAGQREAFERAQPVSAPGPLDEVVALRFQEPAGQLGGHGAVAFEQTVGGGAGGRHELRSYARIAQYATAVYVKT